MSIPPPADPTAVRRVARSAIAELDPRELVLFDHTDHRLLLSPSPARREPGDFGSVEVMDSLAGGVLAASAALVELALVGVSARTWRWFATRLATRRNRPDGTAGMIGTEAPGGTGQSSDEGELIRELDRIYRVAYGATEPFITDEAERHGIAGATLAAYIQDRLTKVDAGRS